MRYRPSARILIVNPINQVLLFRFSHHTDRLAGKTYWATPGGGCEAGESFEEAALRELYEETGIIIKSIGPCRAQQKFSMMLPDGEIVIADERIFCVRVQQTEIRTDHWCTQEHAVISEYRWWSLHELEHTSEIIFPSCISKILATPLTQCPLILHG